MTRPAHLSLFTGIGGIDLAAEWAGFRTVGQVERDPFCNRVLARHWPDVPRWGDIHDFAGDEAGPVDLVSGGFPCQPFSASGLKRGVDDHRHLWPEMLRVIRQARPAWVVGENAANLVTLALDLVASDLEALGYEVEAFVFPAGGLAAPHLRQRCFVVAHAPQLQLRQEPPSGADGAGCAGAGALPGEGALLADPAGARRDPGLRAPDRPLRDRARGTQPERRGDVCRGPGHWAAEPRVGRVAPGLPGRLDRLIALGNAVVPQQVYPLLREIHRHLRGGDAD